MFLVGLTGGIACGKTTVSSMLVDLGCPLIDADQVAREVVEPGRRAWRKIRHHFGPEVFTTDGTLNREQLGQIIFSDTSKRRLLNSITHPEIYKVIFWRVLGQFLRGRSFVVMDVPLLYEGGKFVNYMSSVVVVTCNDENQLERLKQRNGYTTEEAQQRIHAQMSLAEKCRRADYVIDNSGSRDETARRVVEVYEEICRSKAHWKVRVLLGVILVGSACLLTWALRNIL